MNLLPQMKQLTTKASLKHFSEVYEKSSGLPIPAHFLQKNSNRVFGIFWRKELIGGFILGRGPAFRTVELFAQNNRQAGIYERLGDPSQYTEICCFWIKRQFRRKTSLNFFTWFSMAYALKRYGTAFFIYGTCSRSLARLYGQTNESVLINRDVVNNKATFIFTAQRSRSLKGMLEIIGHKFRRVLNLSVRSQMILPS